MADLNLSAGTAALLRDKTFLTQGNEQGIDQQLPSINAAEAKNDSTELKSSQVAHLTDSSRLHLALRQLAAMDTKLSETKKMYAERCARVAEGQRKFAERQAATLAYLRRFRPFVIESETKRQRAERKYAEEHKTIQQKTLELQTLKNELQTLQQRRAHLSRRNTAYRSSQSYLEAVLLHSDAYSELDELLNRYQILKNTNADLTRDAAQISQKMESLHAETKTYTKQQQNSLLLLNSRYASLLTQLEKSNNKLQANEQEQSITELRSRDVQTHLCEITMSIRNIHMRSGLRKKQQLQQQRDKLAAQQAIQQQQQAKQQQLLALTSGAASAQQSANAATNATAKLTESALQQQQQQTQTSTTAKRNPTTATKKPATASQGNNAAASSNADADDFRDESTVLSALGHASSSAKLQAHLLELLDSISERLSDLHYIVTENAHYTQQQQLQQQLALQQQMMNAVNGQLLPPQQQQQLLLMLQQQQQQQQNAQMSHGVSSRSLSPHHSMMNAASNRSLLSASSQQQLQHSRSFAPNQQSTNSLNQSAQTLHSP
jgi:hypothetical protein